MLIQSLKLFNFRNVTNCELTFHPRLNFFVGLNGQGKTNLVEAITFLSITKSFRGSKSADLIKWGESEAGLICAVEESLGQSKLRVEISKKGRKLFINENPTSTTEFVGRLVCISFSPNDIDIIKGGPSERRRFLDKHTVDVFPGTLQYILKYNAALERKNAILKQADVTYDLVDPWNQVLAEAGWHIYEARKKVISLFSPLFKEVHGAFAAVDGAAECEYKSRLQRIQNAQEYYLGLKDHFQQEIHGKQSSFGPHKDDLLILIGGVESRAFASQGQSKSLALSLRLAAIRLFEEERKETPVVVLDDVDSELDTQRLARLYEFIFDSPRQVFVTTTEKRAIATSQSEVFFVSGGEIRVG